MATVISMTALPSTVDMYDLRMSEGARPLYEKVKKFIEEEIEPKTAEFFRLGEGREDHWGYGEGQLELLDSIKAKAKANGLCGIISNQFRCTSIQLHVLQLHCRCFGRQRPLGYLKPA